MRNILLAVAFTALASGCAPTATSSGGKFLLADGDVVPTDPAAVILSTGDIERKYEALTEISATAQSATGLSSVEPSKDLLDTELRRYAGELGADAVINISYGTVDPLSAGGLFLGPVATAVNKPLQATGTAVRFVE